MFLCIFIFRIFAIIKSVLGQLKRAKERLGKTKRSFIPIEF